MTDKNTTDAAVNTVIEMLKFALASNKPERRVKIITDAQHHLAWASRSAVAECVGAGHPWRAIAGTMGLSHGVLHRQYSAGGPVVAAEPRYTMEVHVIVGFRTVGDPGDPGDTWQLVTEDDAADSALESGTFFFDPSVPADTLNPFAGRDLEVRYRTYTDPNVLNTLGRAKPYPLWHPEIGRRPLHMTEEVFDQLFGPPTMGSPERRRWEIEGERRFRLREAAAEQQARLV